jgi:hypothetical protein
VTSVKKSEISYESVVDASKPTKKEHNKISLEEKDSKPEKRKWMGKIT